MSYQQSQWLSSVDDRPNHSLPPHTYASIIWLSPTQDRIARELRELAPEQRELVWADLTANPRTSRYKLPAPEDPKMVTLKLKELKENVLNLKSSNSAYMLAERIAPNYVHDKAFQLMFLRADRFDTKAAALRITRHFEAKKELFGEALLGRDITIADLNDDDLESLNSGAFKLLPGRDQAGRSLLWSQSLGRTQCCRTRENMYRAFWYLNFTAAKEDDKRQESGMVRIMSFLDNYPSGGPDHELNRMQIKLMNCLPNRTVALYVLFEDDLWSKTLDLLYHLLSPMVRLRTRTISGSKQECNYALKCLGIPPLSIPIDMDDESGDEIHDFKDEFDDASESKIDNIDDDFFTTANIVATNDDDDDDDDDNHYHDHDHDHDHGHHGHHEPEESTTTTTSEDDTTASSSQEEDDDTEDEQEDDDDALSARSTISTVATIRSGYKRVAADIHHDNNNTSSSSSSSSSERRIKRRR